MTDRTYMNMLTFYYLSQRKSVQCRMENEKALVKVGVLGLVREPKIPSLVLKFIS